MLNGELFARVEQWMKEADSGPIRQVLAVFALVLLGKDTKKALGILKELWQYDMTPVVMSELVQVDERAFAYLAQELKHQLTAQISRRKSWEEAKRVAHALALAAAVHDESLSAVIEILEIQEIRNRELPGVLIQHCREEFDEKRFSQIEHFAKEAAKA